MDMRWLAVYLPFVGRVVAEFYGGAWRGVAAVGRGRSSARWGSPAGGSGGAASAAGAGRGGARIWWWVRACACASALRALLLVSWALGLSGLLSTSSAVVRPTLLRNT